MELRKEVKAFAAMMEYKLKKNDHKGNFENTDVDFLLKRLKEEVNELEIAIKSESYFEVMLEAADVANFACILVWNILRNQVIGHDTMKNIVEKIWEESKVPPCNCDSKWHTYECAIRVYYRETCTCNANGELNKTHTLYCKTSEERANV
jgi:phosphoribosyl-ATP pyrophosphohydrolase